MRAYAVLITLVAFLLSACGGENAATATSKQASVTVSSPLRAAGTPGTFSGVRSNYTITRSANGVVVTDNVGTDGTTTLDNSVQTLKFADVTVNLQIGIKAASISTADLKTLIELYVAYFNRVPDAEGLGYWIDQLKTGQSLEQIGKSFYDAAVQYSSLTGYSATMTNADFVRLIYKNVLGRTSVDQQALDYWTGALASGAETRGTLVKKILGSAHTFKGDATYGAVADLLDNKVTVANYFAVQQGLSYNTATDSITKGMSIAGAVTSVNTSNATRMIGAPDPKFDLSPSCFAPAVLQNGVCVSPANKPPRPIVKFSIAVSPAGQTYSAILCYDPNQCDSLGESVFVSTADIQASQGDIPAAVEAARKVVEQYNNMISRLWAANTIPSSQTLVSVFTKAIAAGLASESGDTAVSEAISGFNAAGFPAAGSGSGSTTGSSGSGASSSTIGAGTCDLSGYAGPKIDPQYDTFCQNAYVNTCLDKATGTTTYQSQTKTICGVLDGFLKATGGTSAAKYCSYCR